MNILILNGSPKGKLSVTIQTAFYLEKLHPEHEFTYLNVAQKVGLYEKNFTDPKDAITKADIIVFYYPVYTLLVPYQLQRFFELMKKENVSLEGKFVTQCSTSKHFFDTTAHKYLEQNVLDFQCHYLGGLSADMEDLLEKNGQKQAADWFEKVLFDITIGNYKTGRKPEEQEITTPFTVTGTAVEKSNSKQVVIVTNVSETDHQLQGMIDEFIAQCPYPVAVKNVRTFGFQGGCIGCLKCSVTGDCFYRDNFQEFLREEIQTSNAIIYAFSIEQHYTHSSFKCYDDRQFCNGHRAVTHGIPVGYIISGKYSEEYNVQTIVEARCEVSKMYLAGIATDEGDTAKEIKNLALSLDYALKHRITKPTNFYGVGGTKIFRDLVYLMQGMMKADHKFYKDHGIYDFPHNQKMKMFQMKMVGALLSLPNAQEKMKGSMSEYILMPYTKIIEEAGAKDNK